MGQMFIEIESVESLTDLLIGAKKKGMMKDISVEKVERVFRNKKFPIRVEIDIEKVLDLTDKHSMAKKMFGKKIEDATLAYLNKAAGAGV